MIRPPSVAFLATASAAYADRNVLFVDCRADGGAELGTTAAPKWSPISVAIDRLLVTPKALPSAFGLTAGSKLKVPAHPVKPFRSDQSKYLSDCVVELTTPAGQEGFGTTCTFTASALPI